MAVWCTLLVVGVFSGAIAVNLLSADCAYGLMRLATACTGDLTRLNDYERVLDELRGQTTLQASRESGAANYSLFEASAAHPHRSFDFRLVLLLDLVDAQPRYIDVRGFTWATRRSGEFADFIDEIWSFLHDEIGRTDAEVRKDKANLLGDWCAGKPLWRNFPFSIQLAGSATTLDGTRADVLARVGRFVATLAPFEANAAEPAAAPGSAVPAVVARAGRRLIAASELVAQANHCVAKSGEHDEHARGVLLGRQQEAAKAGEWLRCLREGVLPAGGLVPTSPDTRYCVAAVTQLPLLQTAAIRGGKTPPGTCGGAAIARGEHLKAIARAVKAGVPAGQLRVAREALPPASEAEIAASASALTAAVAGAMVAGGLRALEAAIARSVKAGVAKDQLKEARAALPEAQERAERLAAEFSQLQEHLCSGGGIAEAAVAVAMPMVSHGEVAAESDGGSASGGGDRSGGGRGGGKRRADAMDRISKLVAKQKSGEVGAAGKKKLKQELKSVKDNGTKKERRESEMAAAVKAVPDAWKVRGNSYAYQKSRVIDGGLTIEEHVRRVWAGAGSKKEQGAEALLKHEELQGHGLTYEVLASMFKMFKKAYSNEVQK